MKLTITAYSTALFSTWINVEELNLLIDAGDGIVSSLLQKSRKVKHVFVTHPDRDHLNGLPQFVQLNARPDFPVIYYPKDSGSFPAMAQFLNKFDPHVEQCGWIGIEDGQKIMIKKDLEVEALRNEHIKSPVGIHKSLSYKIFEVRKKMKTEFLNLSSSGIKEIVDKKGRDFLTYELRNNIISFSGDTPVDDYQKWNNSEILIHEATFLKNESNSEIESRKNKHSTVDEVLRMVSEIKIEKLILNHFSSRYSKAEINETVLRLLKIYNIDIPVFLIYPGEISRDILATNPINA